MSNPKGRKPRSKVPVIPIEDARATLRSAVLMAVVDTCGETGLRADSRGLTALREAVIGAVTHPSVAWATVLVIEDRRAKPKEP